MSSEQSTNQSTRTGGTAHSLSAASQAGGETLEAALAREIAERQENENRMFDREHEDRAEAYKYHQRAQKWEAAHPFGRYLGVPRGVTRGDIPPEEYGSHLGKRSVSRHFDSFVSSARDWRSSRAEARHGETSTAAGSEQGTQTTESSRSVQQPSGQSSMGHQQYRGADRTSTTWSGSTFQGEGP